MTARCRRRFLPIVFLCLSLFAALPLQAQVPGLPGSGTADAAPAVPGDLEKLVNTLEDPARRDQLLRDLKTLLQVQKKAAEAKKAATVGIHLGDALEDQTQRVGAVFQRFVDWIGTFDQLPGWFGR